MGAIAGAAFVLGRRAIIDTTAIAIAAGSLFLVTHVRKLPGPVVHCRSRIRWGRRHTTHLTRDPMQWITRERPKIDRSGGVGQRGGAAGNDTSPTAHLSVRRGSRALRSNLPLLRDRRPPGGEALAFVLTSDSVRDDSRHHWAVRMVRAGMPLELVARQLGHRDVVMAAKVYARFVPTHQERDRWELAASALDIERWPELGTVAGTAPNTKSSQPLVRDWPVSSRGGTRTRDPGIMSAVL